MPGFDSKLTAVGFGFFIPFFFVFSGMSFDLDALFASAGGDAQALVFFVLFLVVRGVPGAAALPRVLDARDRVALAFFTSTQLPLVSRSRPSRARRAHARLDRRRAGGRRGPLDAVFPILGLRLRGDTRIPAPEVVDPQPA